MILEWTITYFRPERQGIFFSGDSVQFAVENPYASKECGVIFYDRENNETRIPFREQGKRGTLYGLQAAKADIRDYRYNFYFGEEIVTDPYARSITGLEKWGAFVSPRQTWGSLQYREFDWGEDKPLEIPYEDSILYGLNVRAFTMHKSAGVRHPGTFEGITEKTDYLKGLGVTGIVLMPCYEYDECMYPLGTGSAPDQAAAIQESNARIRLNCWGFQAGWYFAPKASYSSGETAVNSFKAMVKKLHENGLEVIMHFYFPPEIRQLYILEVIKFWVLEYHIDGVRLSGVRIPYRLLAQEPVLKSTKIWGEALPAEDMDAFADAPYRNFAEDHPDYQNSIRRFLKGDEGLVETILSLQRRNPAAHGIINYLADYKGFSLYDCVSYDRKHNEENGEDNRDGSAMNYSWNCGVEGETRKKAVVALRLKQIKNAFSFLLLAQGTPFIFSGDEMANTRYGNNNSYCQDNDTGWVKWRDNSFSREILSYVRFLIGLRKAHRILHMPGELQIMDSMGNGYPDLSYHGIEAWRPDLSYMSRMVGVVQCGQYVPDEGDDFFYIAYNMHWDPHKLALPKLPKGEKWVKLSDTAGTEEKAPAKETEAVSQKVSEPIKSSTSGSGNQTAPGGETQILVPGRSISLFQSMRYEIETPKKADRKKDRKTAR